MLSNVTSWVNLKPTRINVLHLLYVVTLDTKQAIYWLGTKETSQSATFNRNSRRPWQSSVVAFPQISSAKFNCHLRLVARKVLILSTETIVGKSTKLRSDIRTVPTGAFSTNKIGLSFSVKWCKSRNSNNTTMACDFLKLFLYYYAAFNAPCVGHKNDESLSGNHDQIGSMSDKSTQMWSCHNRFLSNEYSQKRTM